MFEWLYEWVWEFVSGISNILDWLTTPIEILGLNLAPIYLVVGSAATIGLLRRIL